jgi:VIT1/CCC1 family predicted Fe2+/Mn2+ transporter
MTNELERLQSYWRDEMAAAQTYEQLANAARDERARSLLLQMRDVERGHAARWETLIRQMGGQLPPPPKNRRGRWLAFLARVGAPGWVYRRLEQVEGTAVAAYQEQPPGAASAALAAEMRADEQQHVWTLGAMSVSEATGVGQILGRERWHRGGGSSIRELIFGINDGLVSTLSLVSGVAGADPGRGVILLAGVAGLLAGAISMAAGAYISSKSEREVYEAEVERERQELRDNPEEEMEELRILYQIQGFDEAEAGEMVARLTPDREGMLQRLLQEELGLAPERFPNPWKAGAFSGGAFVVGAIVPLLAHFFLSGITAVAFSVGLSVSGLFVIGVLKTLFTQRPWWRSGLEMVGIGLLATAVTYLIGTLFGVQVG